MIEINRVGKILSCLGISVVNGGYFQLFVVYFPDHMNTESLPCNGNRCGHCKKLAPEYEKLGSSFKKAKSILIGKVSSSPLFYINYINR